MNERESDRRERLRALFDHDGIDALLILSEANIRYLTGFTGHDAWLLLGRDRATIVSDGRFTTQLPQECPEIEPLIRPIGRPIAEEAGRLASRLGCRRLGIETGVMTVADYEVVRAHSGATELLHAPRRIEQLRMVKDSDEISRIRAAVSSAEQAMSKLLANLGADETEKSIADRLEWEVHRAGADSVSFPTIVAGGERAALPHARPSRHRSVRNAELLLIDWGASRDGYKSDLTRVFPTGNVNRRLEQIYRIVLAAQSRAISAIRPGARAEEVDLQARVEIEAAGYGPYFSHGIGHGLGLEIHEGPMMRVGSDIELRPGMVVTVEPGIYLPEWGGVRIEDDVLVTEDGFEILTTAEKAFDALPRLFG
ncbi:MAG: Xaa-Pro peptidase family protein [Isosphaeraceae bacterium]|nr:Xaa-Pro peptidase family protein [Isosphaeraceae bacterium]